MTRPLYDIASSCMCSIYVIKNSVNNKVYVGQTWRSIERRFQVHLQNSTANHCLKLRRAIQKYGIDAFGIELLTFCHTQEMANYWEIYFIRKFNSVKNGYNVLEYAFNRKGTKHSAKTKKKMSENNKGHGNGNSILEQWQVDQIKEEYQNYSNPNTGSKYGVITFLSKKYNVSISTIFEIVKGFSWK
jgi:group I intron endonuclease